MNPLEIQQATRNYLAEACTLAAENGHPMSSWEILRENPGFYKKDEQTLLPLCPCGQPLDGAGLELESTKYRPSRTQRRRNSRRKRIEMQKKYTQLDRWVHGTPITTKNCFRMTCPACHMVHRLPGLELPKRREAPSKLHVKSKKKPKSSSSETIALPRKKKRKKSGLQKFLSSLND